MAIIKPTNEQLFKSEQEKKIKQQFSQGRLRLGGQQRRTERSVGKDIDRFSAISGVRTGAVQKARGQALDEVGRGFGEAEAGLSAQESAALQQAGEASRGREFSREERLGSQEFAASESEKQRALVRDQLDRQFDLAWAEFDESVKANFINAAIATKEAGLRSSSDWEKVFRGGGVTTLFGDLGQRAGSVSPAERENEELRRERQRLAIIGGF